MEPISIIGYACRLPGAKNHKQLWNLLTKERCSITSIPESRFATRRYQHPDRAMPGKSVNFFAGVIDDVFGFDAGFFGISPREAKQMDPQQRIMLQVVWESLENSGICPSSLAGKSVGVYVGTSATEYNIQFGFDPATIDAQTMTGNTLSIVSNRISYQLDLRGPSFTVDTACSSALVAFSLACDAIASGEIDTAIVGGINILLSPFPFVGFSRAFMLSGSGRCRAFDAEGDGYVRSEGAVSFIIQSKQKAISSGRSTLADIVGWGTNSDGRTHGMALPSTESQYALLESIYNKFNLNRANLAFVEAHGTGTRVGDPAEANAIGRALAQHCGYRLPIGSIKTNIGHLEPASGLAGLLKATLSLEHGLFPASLHFVTPNPDIQFEDLNLMVASSQKKLKLDRNTIAGVNSFGFGGTNAHVVLKASDYLYDRESTKQLSLNSQCSGKGELLPLILSATTTVALNKVVEATRDFLEKETKFTYSDILKASALQKEKLEHRCVILPMKKDELIKTLSDVIDGNKNNNVVLGKANSKNRPIAFAFSGNGSQWPGMGLSAYKKNHHFRKAFDEVSSVFAQHHTISLTNTLNSPNLKELLTEAMIAQGLLFAVQVGIFNALKASNFSPCAVFGHSAGEVAAAWASGALSLEDAVKVVYVRSTFQEVSRNQGGMAAVMLSREQAEDLFAQEDYDGLEIAAVNTGKSITVSGSHRGLQKFLADARGRRIAFRRIDVAYPFHSRFAEPIKQDLLANLQDLHSNSCSIPFISTVHGVQIRGEELGADYWWQNIRRTVEFKSAVETALELQPGIILEIGPAPVLTGYMADIFKSLGLSTSAVASLEANDDQNNDPVLKTILKCFVNGASIPLEEIYGKDISTKVDLPNYTWENIEYRLDVSPERLNVLQPAKHFLLGLPTREDNPTYYNHIDLENFPWLKDHKIEDAIVFPGAAILEMILATAIDILHGAPIELRGCSIFRPLIIEPGVVQETMVRVFPEDTIIDFMSRPRGKTDDWTHHARCKYGPAPNTSVARIPSFKNEILSTASAKDVYEMMKAFRLNYGESFRRLMSVNIYAGDIAEVEFLPTLIDNAEILLDPTIVDSAFHGAIFSLFADGKSLPKNSALLPVRIENLRLYKPGMTIHKCLVQRGWSLEGSSLINLSFISKFDEVIAVVSGGRFAEVSLERNQASPSFYQPIMVPLDIINYPSSPTSYSVDSLANVVQSSNKFAHNESNSFDSFYQRERVSILIVMRSLREVFGDYEFQLFDINQGGRLCPESLNFVETLLYSLERLNLVVKSNENWRIIVRDDFLPDVSEIKKFVSSEIQSGSDAALLSFLYESLTDILLGNSKEPFLSSFLNGSLLYAPCNADEVSNTFKGIVDYVSKTWPKTQPLRVMILGSNGLSFVKTISEIIKAITGSVTISDSDPSHLELMTSELQKNDNIRVAGSIFDIEPAKENFDLIFAFNIIKIDNISELLNRIYDLTAQGGSLIFASNPPSIFEKLRLLGMCGLNSNQNLQFLPQLRESASSFCQFLENAGFVDVSSGGYGDHQRNSVFYTGKRNKANFEKVSLGLAEKDISLLFVEETRLTQSLTSLIRSSGAKFNSLKIDESFGIEDVSFGKDIVLSILSEVNSDPLSRITMACERLVKIFSKLQKDNNRIWLIAPGAYQLTHSITAGDPDALAITGFARVAYNEFPNLDIRIIDTSLITDIGKCALRVVQELNLERSDKEILLDENSTYGLRVISANSEVSAATKQAYVARLTNDVVGQLEGLSWNFHPRLNPSEDEIEIEVQATGLNFRDVMWSLGFLPDEALESGFVGPTLGMECAGTITRLGSRVNDLKLGDRCLAFAPASFSSHVLVPRDVVCRIPNHLNTSAAATIPVAFLTAYYSLKHLARITSKEVVLVHGAAGGVGLAAIQIIKLLGAVPIATAGSPEKRAYLRMLGCEHVFNSRDNSFADEIMRVTSGQGVDVVLNSLAGEGMERSIGCLRNFGRFIELGKRDFFADTRIGLRPFRRNLSYFGVDADQLLTRYRKLSHELFEEIIDLFDNKKLVPLPYRCFKGEDVVSAFRLMQRAGHIGKIVVEPAKTINTLSSEPPKIQLKHDAVYVIIGGFGGFGLALTGRLFDRGARHFVLVGRRGAASQDVIDQIHNLRMKGAVIVEEKLDASEFASLDKLFKRLSSEPLPIAGIFHSAMVLDDALITNLSVDRIENVLRSKVTSAKHLDILSRDLPGLQHFILFSSASTIVGNPGQANYVAANAYLEGLARVRKTLGLPGVAIAWGAISDAGYLAGQSKTNTVIAKKLKKQSITIEEALDGLEMILIADKNKQANSVVGFGRIDWKSLYKDLRLASTPMLERYNIDTSKMVNNESSDQLSKELSKMTSLEAQGYVVKMLVVEISRILRVSSGQIDIDKPLSEIGVDSLMGVELKLSAEESLGVEIPMMSVSGAGSLRSLANSIVVNLSQKTAPS